MDVYQSWAFYWFAEKQKKQKHYYLFCFLGLHILPGPHFEEIRANHDETSIACILHLQEDYLVIYSFETKTSRSLFDLWFEITQHHLEVVLLSQHHILYQCPLHSQ